MSNPDNSMLPTFLQSYSDLNNHIRETLENLENVDKGKAFARFATRIIPLSDLGEKFVNIEIGPDGPDGGIDLMSNSIDGKLVLYGQSKLTIRKSEEIDNIISKFHNFYESIHTTRVGQRYMPDFKEPSERNTNKGRARKITKKGPSVVETNDDVPTECSFVIVTLSHIEGRVLSEYEKSNYSSKAYYNELIADNKLTILDGPKIFPLAQASYRKSNIIPSNIDLHLVGPYLHQDNVYIGVVSAGELKRCYKDFGEALFLDNIRLFLGYSSKPDRENVNASIRETAEKYPREMLARNNGITFRADVVRPISDNILHLERASIVNGCQTTKCIVDATEDSAYILVKIVSTEEAWSIAKTANSQTRVDQLVLELARYIRPQAVKIAASKAGYIVTDIGETIYDVFNGIYKEGVVYDEIFYLFVGLVSREPKNVINMNYTEVQKHILNQLQNRDPAGDNTLLLLFRLFSAAIEGKRVAENTYQNEQSRVYKRFWEDNKPDYRSVLTLLAACGCVKMNIYKNLQENVMETFLDKLDSVLSNDRQKYIRYYCYAYEAVVSYLNSKRGAETPVEKQRYMYDDLRGAPFEALYNQICLTADFRESIP